MLKTCQVRTSSNAFPPLTFEFPNYVRLNFKGYCEDHDLDAVSLQPRI
jgi:hypothetical protein